MPRIGWNGEVRMIPSHGSFRQVELPEEDGAGGVQPGDYRRVKGRDMVYQDLRPSHGANAFGKAQVFHRHWHSMQGTAVGPSTDVPLWHPGRLQGMLSHHSRIAFVTPVELGDAIEECPRHFNG